MFFYLNHLWLKGIGLNDGWNGRGCEDGAGHRHDRLIAQDESALRRLHRRAHATSNRRHRRRQRLCREQNLRRLLRRGHRADRDLRRL